MRNDDERERLYRALADAASGLTEDPFLYERIMAQLTKGEPVVKKKLSLGLVLALVLAALTLTGFAAGLLFGQEWYLTYRDLLLENEPAKYGAVLDRLAAPSAQTDSGVSLAEMTVQDIAWVPEQEIFTVSLRATPKDPAHFELHPMWNLDADGAYVGGDALPEPDEDGEDRSVHWLWRNDADRNEAPRHGLPADMMDDPAKALLLIDVEALRIGGMNLSPTTDVVRLSDGSCVFYLECALDWLADGYDEQIALRAQRADADTQAYYAQLREQAAQARELLTADSGLTCTAVYRVVALAPETPDEELYLGGEHGTVDFTVMTR